MKKRFSMATYSAVNKVHWPEPKLSVGLSFMYIKGNNIYPVDEKSVGSQSVPSFQNI